MKFIEFSDTFGNPFFVNPEAIAFVTKHPMEGNAIVHLISGETKALTEGYEVVVSCLTGEATGK